MVRSTPASFVGSGYGVSFSKRYSVRNVTPRAAPALSNLLSYCARHHDTVMTPAGGSLGSMLKKSSAVDVRPVTSGHLMSWWRWLGYGLRTPPRPAG
jgi:enterochelin esterase-like enzyme